MIITNRVRVAALLMQQENELQPGQGIGLLRFRVQADQKIAQLLQKTLWKATLD